MATSETDRLHLFEIARAKLDEAAARTLMDLLPPDPSRLATGEDMAVSTAMLRTEMAGIRTELKTEMADLRTELKTEMADLRTELKTEMGDLRTDFAAKIGEQTRTLLLANIAMWLSIAALVVGLRFT